MLAPIDNGWDEAHRHFSVACFNQAWELIDTARRSPAEDEAMILRSMASAWHWSQRPDCTQRSRAIGCWQISRVLALAHLADSAAYFAQLSLKASRDEGPFHQAFAHEALGRARQIGGDLAGARAELDQAHSLLTRVDDLEDRQALEHDLSSLQSLLDGGPNPTR